MQKDWKYKYCTYFYRKGLVELSYSSYEMAQVGQAKAKPRTCANAVSRTFGFYPAGGGGKLSHPMAKGSTFRNNENHQWSEMISKTIGEADFNAILSTASKYEQLPYNLDSRNCTTFAEDAAMQAGISFQNSISTWSQPTMSNPFGYGVGADPAGLGQSILEGHYENMDRGGTRGGIGRSIPELNQ
jgi:hypothetical protein